MKQKLRKEVLKRLKQEEVSLKRMSFGSPHKRPGDSHSARNLRRVCFELGRLRSQGAG